MTWATTRANSRLGPHAWPKSAVTDTGAKSHFYQCWPKSDFTYAEKGLKRATYEAQVRIGPGQKDDLGHELSAGFFWSFEGVLELERCL
jgi:hypothetical protein